MGSNWRIGDKLPDPSTGQGRWEIHNILRGGMGIVYVVYDNQWREVFAAKTFQDQFLHSKIVRDRFVQEAHTWINLELHQHIVLARLVEIIESKPYIFLEYFPGGDLSCWIATPRLTLEHTLRLTIQFCYGMAYAYSKGIKAHRDIKPQNCFITEDSSLKIGDFGLAKVFDDAEMRVSEVYGASGLSEVEPRGRRLQVGLSQTGRAAGTPLYMAPEQFDDAKHVDARADIYSFGVMLFEMVTGEVPFKGRTWGELKEAHKTQPVPSLRGRLPKQAWEVEDVVRSCLEKQPSKRPQSFDDIRERLEHILERLTGEKVPASMESVELDVRYLNSRGSSLNYLGKYSEALSVLEQVLQRIDLERILQGSPHHSMVWNNKGYALMHLGRRGDAMASFDTALAIDPKNFHALTNKGFLLFEAGHPSDALQCHERALSINPNSSLAWNSKGRTLQAMRKFDDAWACYWKALQIDPRNTLILGNIGWLLAEAGRHEEALVWFDRALAVDPFYDEGLNAKALSLAACDRYEEALACLEKALEASPKNPVFWQNMGSMFLQLKRYQEALNAFDKALELDPGERIARQGRAICRIMLQAGGGRL